MDPLIGQTIDGRYLVERGIGEGGMGIVYAGQHRVIGKKVAIKVLRGEMVSDSEAAARFLQEARSAGAIGNPHIVDISDFGRLPDGATYFVMELLEGKGLTQVMHEARGPMHVARVFHIGKQIARGLAAAHASSIIHRDLKPDNVMLVTRGTERDFVKILDFGIAKVAGVSTMTRAGSVFGTPHYMSPEQAAGAPVDHRTDIYALGVILYEMAAGRVPFDADNMMGILTQHMYKMPAPMRARVPPVDVPPSLDAIVLKCLSKKPDERYATMDELVADLERGERGVVPNAVPEMTARSGRFDAVSGFPGMPLPVPASPSQSPSGGPIVAMVSVGAVLMVAIGVVVAVKLGGRNAHALPAAAATPAAAAPHAGPSQDPAGGPGAGSAGVAAVATAAVSAVEPAAPAQREVIISAVPADAVIQREGVDLGTQPVALHLAQGESATVTISRKGYKTKTMTLDGSDPKVAITLEGAFAPPSATPAPARRRPVDDVGDPFANKPR
jgi:serine/threonine-protein kinase